MIVATAIIVYLLALVGALLLIAVGVWYVMQEVERAATALERLATVAERDGKVVTLRPTRPAA